MSREDVIKDSVELMLLGYKVKSWHDLPLETWNKIIGALEDLHQKTGIDRKELKAAFNKIVAPLWKKEKGDI